MSNIASISNELRSLLDFQGDFDQLAVLMEQSWSENHAQSLLYTQPFLESCFQYPGSTFALAPTIYHGSTPVGFVAGFPRSVRYMGSDRKILIITFLTVAPEFKKAGYGIVLWSELVKRAQALGFDGMMNYCVEGEAMNGMILGCCHRMRLPVEHIFSVSYLSSILWPRAVSATATETAFDPIDALLDEAAPIADRTPLARQWTPQEARWQCTRPDAVLAHYECESRRGLLTGSIMELTDANHTRTLLVEDVLWGSLQAEERVRLVKLLVAKATAQGARMATVPVQGYADMEPFRAARFRPSTRVLHAYFTLWNGPSSLERVPSFYLDVF